VHGQVAQMLEVQFPDMVASQPELLAHHYTEAGLYAQAVGYWQRAGERVNQHSAYIEAIIHLRKGLEVLSHLPESSERDQHELALQIALFEPLTCTDSKGNCF
jgi:predicted ATPase